MSLEGHPAYEAGWKDCCHITDELVKSVLYDNEGLRQLNARLVDENRRLRAAPAGRAPRAEGGGHG